MIFKDFIRICLIVAAGMLMHISCNKEEEYTGNTLRGGKVLVLGHMGMGIAFNEPGNTYGSISTAISIGCDGSEMDIQLTRDSVLVAYHDHDLASQTSCKGKIIDHTWEEIKGCKYSMAVKPIFLLSLNELFEQLPDRGNLYFSFDCKLESGLADQEAYEFRYLRAVKRICDQYGIETHVFLEGPGGFLDKAAQIGLNTKLFLFSNNDDDPASKARQKYQGISTTRDISAADIEKAFHNGLYVMVWDPDNYYQNKETLAKKPDIIQTDDPISMLKLLKRYNYENVTP